MHTHEKVVCRKCQKVVRQCRCMEGSKFCTYVDECEDCKSRPKWPDDGIPVIPPLPPNNPNLGKVRCGECGMVWEGVMGYVCGNLRCPVQRKVIC